MGGLAVIFSAAICGHVPSFASAFLLAAWFESALRSPCSRIARAIFDDFWPRPLPLSGDTCRAYYRSAREQELRGCNDVDAERQVVDAFTDETAQAELPPATGVRGWRRRRRSKMNISQGAFLMKLALFNPCSPPASPVRTFRCPKFPFSLCFCFSVSISFSFRPLLFRIMHYMPFSRSRYPLLHSLALQIAARSRFAAIFPWYQQQQRKWQALGEFTRLTNVHVLTFGESSVGR
jgi:hypothetical protein